MKKKTKGFTLLEVVLSVGILTLMSIGILKIFVASNAINKQALATDNSVRIIQQVIALLDEGKYPGEGTDPLMMKFEKKGDTDFLLNLGEDFVPDSDGKYLLSLELKGKKQSNEKQEDLYKLDLQVLEAENNHELVHMEMERYLFEKKEGTP